LENCVLYRYRTPALVGEWRTSAEQACEDAIRARQADRDDDGSVKWRASARLEANGENSRMSRPASRSA